MQAKTKLHPQYVTDPTGHRTGVILSLDEFEELLEDIDDLAVAAERRDEKTIPHSKVRSELKKNGCLQD